MECHPLQMVQNLLCDSSYILRHLIYGWSGCDCAPPTGHPVHGINNFWKEQNFGFKIIYSFGTYSVGILFILKWIVLFRTP